MWTRNKRTGEYRNVSPAEAKQLIKNDSIRDTQGWDCTCGQHNDRYAETCKACNKEKPANL